MRRWLLGCVFAMAFSPVLAADVDPFVTEYLNDHDTDHSGTLSIAELDAAYSEGLDFKGSDSDGNGFITLQEYPAMANDPNFSLADKNHDQMLTPTEYDVWVDLNTRTSLKGCDTNGDNQASADELSCMLGMSK